MSNQGLSAPGSSAYSSDSLYVGDGTWDSQRNTFLLPNLMGVNFDTMRYNGMGNRFRNMVGYKPLILAHGILAAVTFLFMVPGAIFMARFYHCNPRLALRVHIWLQVLTLLLATALVVLGFQAVGPERSLTNPHHGIGVALYSLVVVQVLGGSIIHRLEKGKERFKVPLKLILHQWIGRVVLLLGIAQIPLGLTLWGSPKVLFILFAVWAFLLLIVYFVLSYRTQPEMGFDDNTTYITERTASTRSRRTSRGGRGIGALATAGAAGAGLAALASRSRSRSRSRRHGDETTVLSSRPGSRSRVTESRFTESYLSDEKYNDKRKGSTWQDRLLGAGAAAGGIFAIKNLFGKKKDRRAYTETLTGSDVSYGRPLGQSEVTQTDLSRLEEGRAPDSPARNQDWRRVEEREAAQAAAMGASPVRANHRPTRSGTSIDSFDSRTSFNDHHDSRPLREESGYGVKDGIMTLGVLGFMKHTWNKRKNRQEDARIEELRQQDFEEEKMARANSGRRRFTGDGAPPHRHNGPPSTIYSETEISGMTPSVARPDAAHPPLTSSAGPSVLRPADNTVLSDSGSEAYVSPGGRSHHRHRNSAGAAALAGGAAAAASSGPPSKRRNSRDESVASPPVSVKVKMHNDGRHVTLRRLNEEEAAAERDARRRERQRRTRSGSMSSLSQFDGDRWRRTEALETQQAQEMAQAQAAGSPPTLQSGAPLQMPEPYIPPPPAGPSPNFSGAAQRPSPQANLPPPPPNPADASILSSPPGTQVYGTETDVSNFDSNRRRRRAERAQAKQARSGGSRVEFS